MTGFGHVTYFGERGLPRSEIFPDHCIVLVWPEGRQGRGGGVHEAEGILCAVFWGVLSWRPGGNYLPTDAPIQGYDLVPFDENISKLDHITKQ